MTLDLVVVGLGYVGLPLALEACRAGMSVVGLETDPERAASLNLGESHVDDISDEDVRCMLNAGFYASVDEEALAGASAIVICVPTPLDEAGGPNLTAVVDAAHAVATHMRNQALVVLESTTWPGTTEEVLLPILRTCGGDVGSDFYLAFSPERIDPGNPVYGLRNTPKVVGGVTRACSERAAEFYSRIVDRVVVAKGTREAEMSKLLENTYRHINIALVNEMAKFSRALGVDIWDVIQCAETKPFGFASFRPGPGVGGHCIPIDPNYLSHHVRQKLGYPFRFVELAQEINQSMPAYVLSRVTELLNRQGRALSVSTVGIFGVTYKAGIADQRESPAVPLGEALLKAGADVVFYDPYVQSWMLGDRCLEVERNPGAVASLADVMVLLQPHASYESDFFDAAQVPVLDTRGVLSGSCVETL